MRIARTRKVTRRAWVETGEVRPAREGEMAIGGHGTPLAWGGMAGASALADCAILRATTVDEDVVEEVEVPDDVAALIDRLRRIDASAWNGRGEWLASSIMDLLDARASKGAK